MRENCSSKKPMVYESSKRVDKKYVIHDAEPLHMVVPVDIFKNNPNRSGWKRTQDNKKGKTFCSRYLSAWSWKCH